MDNQTLARFARYYKKARFVVYGYLTATGQYASFMGTNNTKEALAMARARAKRMSTYAPTDRDGKPFRPDEVRVLDLDTGKDIATYNAKGLIYADKSYGRKMKHAGPIAQENKKG